MSRDKIHRDQADEKNDKTGKLIELSERKTPLHHLDTPVISLSSNFDFVSFLALLYHVQ
jgi:hypothetical protein